MAKCWLEPWIGKARIIQSASQRKFLIGIRSADFIMASGDGSAQSGRTYDRQPPNRSERRKNHLPIGAVL
jgi:hypothetical protein